MNIGFGTPHHDAFGTHGRIDSSAIRMVSRCGVMRRSSASPWVRIEDDAGWRLDRP
jgi:hypothetical protein